MAKPVKQAMFIINVQEEEAKCTESQLDILLKIHDGQYRLVKKNKRSSVWNVYREIARPDGTKLKWRYYCLGCKRVMQSTGGTTSNLRIHKCHVRYLKQHGKVAESPKTQHNSSSSSGKLQRLPVTASKRQMQLYEELNDPKTVEYSDEEEEYEEVDIPAAAHSEVSVRAGQSTVGLANVFSIPTDWAYWIPRNNASIQWATATEAIFRGRSLVTRNDRRAGHRNRSCDWRCIAGIRQGDNPTEFRKPHSHRRQCDIRSRKLCSRLGACIPQIKRRAEILCEAFDWRAPSTGTLGTLEHIHSNLFDNQLIRLEYFKPFWTWSK